MLGTGNPCLLYTSPEIWSKQIINPDHKAYVTRQHSHPDSMLDAMETGEPYDFKMAWFIGTNPLPNMAVQPRRWQAAFEKLEFNVVSDLSLIHIYCSAHTGSRTMSRSTSVAISTLSYRMVVMV